MVFREVKFFTLLALLCLKCKRVLSTQEIEMQTENFQWEHMHLEHTKFPKYLGVRLDRSLNLRKHSGNTRVKVNSRNNILRKLAISKWDADATTLRTSAIALS